MNASLIKLLQDLRGSYWFVPSLLVIASIALALTTTYIDATYQTSWHESYPRLSYNHVDGARATLTTIAGSMITVAGVTFSITMVAVSFASAQFGPRLIGNFMRDRGNQLTLGTFIATFVYSLLVLRSVREAGEGRSESAAAAFIPQISLITAIALALASVAVLIFFIHHVPETINIGNITANLGIELKKSVRSQFPAPPPEETLRQGDRQGQDQTDAEPVTARSDGYLQAIDEEALVKIAKENEVVVRVQYRPGDFVVEGAVLAEIHAAHGVDDKLLNGVRSCFACGRERTATQDTLFLVDQLVEIMIRALSPGVNDPFTASNCIDWLGASLHELLRDDRPESTGRGDAHSARVIAHPLSFERFASCVFDRSRRYVAADPNAAMQMMSVLASLALKASSADQESTLRGHAAALAEATGELLPDDLSRQALTKRHEEFQEALQDKGVEAQLRDNQGWLGGRA